MINESRVILDVKPGDKIVDKTGFHIGTVISLISRHCKQHNKLCESVPIRWTDGKLTMPCIRESIIYFGKAEGSNRSIWRLI